MASVRLMRHTGAIGFFIGSVMLGTLVCTGTASAQCGPLGPAGAKNTACGTGTLSQNTTGTFDSAFGSNALKKNTTGLGNTASGAFALEANTTGTHDTADGAFALFRNTTGNENSAFGKAALFSNTTGVNNTADGFEALFRNTTGFENTASGFNALFDNTTGSDNTAIGDNALHNNTTGGGNTACGTFALAANTTGSDNTASGEAALFFNTTGDFNTASGIDALEFNTTGNDNTAIGEGALGNNTTGGENTANGIGALASNHTGSDNIGLGFGAGSTIGAASNTIEIWAIPPGEFPPFGDESNTIRIGITQKKTFIAGISGTPVLGAEVTVNGNGQLGVLPSSARYKRDIHDMGGASAGLMKLRPVTFRYKNDPSGTLQYGLVAEEVERVYPELVVHGTDGKVLSVRYLEFTALLLNELQKLDERLVTKDQQIAAQQHEIDALKQTNASINALSQRLAALERSARTANADGLRSLARK